VRRIGVLVIDRELHRCNKWYLRACAPTRVTVEPGCVLRATEQAS
jgi:hypothetical protein